MGIRDWFRNPAALVPVTAAASSLEPGQLDSMTVSSNRSSAEAWRVWRSVGEIHYATTQQSRLVSRVAWNITIAGNQLDEEDASRLLQETFGTKVDDLAKTAALHLQVAGGYILARFPEKGWQVFSINPSHTAKAILKTADARVVVTTPDPEDPQRLDSPVIAALDVANELLLARAQSRAQSRNRTAQHGLVLYPQEGAGQDPETFKRNLMTMITAPLSDEKSTASVVPNLIGFPADLIDKWTKLDIGGTYDEKLDRKIEGLIRNLATILDAPPELLLGLGDVNHWTAWAVQEDNWFGHVEPLASEVGQGFAQALAEAALLDPDSVEFIPDPTPLIQRRPSLADVSAAHAAGVVSSEYWRTQLGADDDDAPDALPPAEEPEEVVEGEIVEEPVVELPVAASFSPGTVAFLESRRAVTAAVSPPFSTRRLIAIDQQALDATLDLADAALSRVAERVGAQMRGRVQGDAALKASIADIPNEDLPRKLGDRLAALPGLDQTIQDTLSRAMLRPWSVLVKRAYSATRAAGVDVTLDPLDLEQSGQSLLNTLAGVAVPYMLGQPTDATVWTGAQRALALAGGGGDPAPPTIAALGLPSPVGLGIALGGKALLWVAREVGLLARSFRWVYGSDPRSDPHPAHLSFDGQEFNGEALIEDGIRWYPGDHAGCLCSMEPIWEETS